MVVVVVLGAGLVAAGLAAGGGGLAGWGRWVVVLEVALGRVTVVGRDVVATRAVGLETTGLGGGATALGVTVLGATLAVAVTAGRLAMVGAGFVAGTTGLLVDTTFGRAALAFGFDADDVGVAGLGVETGLVVAIAGGLTAGLVAG